jgi:hypothetical protein
MQSAADAIASKGVFTEACSPYKPVRSAGPLQASKSWEARGRRGLRGRQPARPQPGGARGAATTPCAPAPAPAARLPRRAPSDRGCAVLRRAPLVSGGRAPPASPARARAQPTATYCASRCGDAPDKSYAVVGDLLVSNTTYYSSNGTAYPDRAGQARLMGRIKSLVRKHVRRAAGAAGGRAVGAPRARGGARPRRHSEGRRPGRAGAPLPPPARAGPRGPRAARPGNALVPLRSPKGCPDRRLPCLSRLLLSRQLLQPQAHHFLHAQGRGVLRLPRRRHRRWAGVARFGACGRGGAPRAASPGPWAPRCAARSALQGQRCAVPRVNVRLSSCWIAQPAHVNPVGEKPS